MHLIETPAGRSLFSMKMASWLLFLLQLWSCISSTKSNIPNNLRGNSNIEDKEENLVFQNVSSHSGILSNPSFSKKRMMKESEVDMFPFEPLDCNADPCAAGHTTWKSQGYDPDKGTVVIPCGLCVTMDFDDSEKLVLPEGLDVQGTLQFPNGYKITLETPFVRVQGHLTMAAKGKVTDKPNIRIILTDSSPGFSNFVPARNNQFMCSTDATTPSPCMVGTKPFVVAGGKLDIHGIPEGCPTWVHLEDVIQERIHVPENLEQLAIPVPSNPKCLGLQSFMDESFSSASNHYDWTGGYGTFFSVTEEGTFKVTNRKMATEQGPTWDMKHVRECLIPGQIYLFSARIKLTKPGVIAGTPTSCTEANKNCLSLFSMVRSPKRKHLSLKGRVDRTQSTRYGEWHDFYASFSFSQKELDPENVFQLLYLRDPEAGVDIEMDDVRFSLPEANVIPKATNPCGGNLVLNGDAEFQPVHPYPITSHGGDLAVRQDQGGNQYFHLSGRSSDTDSIVHEFHPSECLVANRLFKFSARIRIDSEAPVRLKVFLRAKFSDDSYHRQTVVECPESTRHGWVKCETRFNIDQHPVKTPLRYIRLMFETVGAALVDMDIDDIEFKALEGPLSSIVVRDDGVSRCWDTGAEILITSHTLNYDDEQVRRLVSPPTPLSDGYVRLDLDSPIRPPTTRRKSRDFASEVALLSRNVVFEGEADPTNDLMGAHLIILRTPKVKQQVQGVEFRNFGQQGELGKYPIHFHLCRDVEGAVVSKNTIRESNQRCIVVHGTHNLTVNDNIAYDTRGHCFMTEDGGEMDNIFQGNLGALTQPADDLVGPDETDNEPSTFWCTNPRNEWVGNVAAGSRDSGFWFELRTEVRGSTAEMPLSSGMIPRELSLKRFHDNVAHSNRRHGLRTYPNGYIPDEAAVFYNTKSFKNKGDGVFFHNSNNLIVKGGVLADNMVQADFDRADSIMIKQTKVLGVSKHYREVIQSQPGAPSHSTGVVGIELHGFALDVDKSGATIRDVKFYDFESTGSDHTALIQVDDEVREGLFNYWTTLKGVELYGNTSAERFDFTSAREVGVSDIYLTDLDSSMSPSGSTAHGTSTIISNSAKMTTFLDISKCQEFPEKAYMYCTDTCLRSIIYRVSQYGTNDLICRIKKTDATDPAKFVDLTAKFYYETVDNKLGSPLDEVQNTSWRKSRYFSIALPPGNYDAKFLDRNGNEVWPTYVESMLEKSQCENSLADDDVKYRIPEASSTVCRELILNGDFEMSLDGYPHWLQRNTALELAKRKGMGGSNAIADTIHNDAMGSIGQYIDTRCLEYGRQYQVQAWVKLERSGEPTSCDQARNCPHASLRIKAPKDGNMLEFDDYSRVVAETFARPYHEAGWNLLQGVFTVDHAIAQGSSVWFNIERGMKGTKMYLDNVTVSMLPNTCNEMVLNGDFSSGNSVHWEKNTDNRKVKLSLTWQKGNARLKMSDRSSSSDSPIQQIRIGCFEKDKRYLAVAKVRVQNPNGSQFICDPSARKPMNECPEMKIRSFSGQDVGSKSLDVAFTDFGLTSDSWQTVSGVFSATQTEVNGEKILLYFGGPHRSKDLVIDEVSISSFDWKCDNLIVNGDAEYDETPRFWRTWEDQDGTTIKLVQLSDDDHALQISNRLKSYDGIHQFVDPICVTKDSKWAVTAKMKLVSRKTGQGVSCDPSATRADSRCPLVAVAGWSSEKKEFDDSFYMSNRPSWNANDFNPYETEFTISSPSASYDRVSIGFRFYNIGWDLLVDDIRVSPLRSL